jgi:hypothetical protein
MIRLVRVRSISAVAVLFLGLVGSLGLETVFSLDAQAATTCAEPSAPCVVDATLKKSTLRVSLASATKVIRVSWSSPSGKPVTKPLPVRKGVTALTVAGINVGTAFPLSLQACTSTKSATCGPAVSWTMQIDPAGAVTALAGGAPTVPSPVAAPVPPAPTAPPSATVAATVAPTNPPTTLPPTTLAPTTVAPTTVAPTTVATTTTLVKLTAAALSVKVSSGVSPALQLLKGSCKTGFVKRNATATDAVCVTPESASRAFIDNEAAKSRIAVSQDGPDGCIAGRTWRMAYQGDVVCVSLSSKLQAKKDNDPALSKSRLVLFNGPDTCKKGFVWRNAGGSIDHICVTIEERTLIEEEGSDWDNAHPYGAPCPFNYFRRNIYDNDDVCVTAARRLKINRDNVSLSTKEIDSMSGPKDSCRAGFAWRLANPDDHICVTTATAAATAAENATAENKVFSQGPETCAEGFVWRQATPEDRVCVLPATADETLRENNSAKTRVN